MTRELDNFGALLIREVRDETIDDWNRMIDGRVKGDLAKAVEVLCKNFSNEQLEVVKKIAAMVADTSLHHMMRMIDQSTNVRLAYICDDGSRELDLKVESDGLAGELYASHGWINRFSKFPTECI